MVASRRLPPLGGAYPAIARQSGRRGSSSAHRPPDHALRVASLFGAAVLVTVGINRPAAAAVFGTLGNFDVVNDTGKTAHGFEIDLDGLTVGDVTDTFGGAGRYFPPSVERYGTPTVSATSTGVSIVYEGTFAGGAWNVGTPSGAFTTPGESCWSGGGIGYGPATPCDHFGVGTSKTPTSTAYHWLTEVAPTSSSLLAVTASLPAPTWTVTPAPPPPPGSPPAPPKVVAQVQAPAPNVAEGRFGTPEWVKVFTTEYDKPVALEDLVAGNGIVPQSPGETEIEWQLLQTDPGDPAAGKIENGGDAGPNAEAVLRNYEFYKYVGDLDPENGQALSETPIVDANGNPISPLRGGNIGPLIGRQIEAINLNGVYDGPPNSPPIDAPEPASLALFGTGLLTLAGLLRRSRV